MTPCLLPPPHSPKFERLRRMAERYPSLGVDLPAMEVYMVMLSLASELWAAVGASLAPYGLGEGRFTVLALLLENQPEPLSHSQLAELSCVTKGNITGLVDGLERDGFVKREESGGDRRVRHISLTPAGRRMIETAMPEHFHRITKLIGQLSPAERETFLSLCRKVQAGLPTFRQP